MDSLVDEAYQGSDKLSSLLEILVKLLGASNSFIRHKFGRKVQLQGVNECS